LFAQLGFNPTPHLVGGAIVEEDELEARMVGVPSEVLEHGLLEMV